MEVDIRSTQALSGSSFVVVRTGVVFDAKMCVHGVLARMYRDNGGAPTF